MTGVNPGQHGVFDFTRREPGTYRVRFVNSTFRKAPSIWRVLSDAGKRVAVLGMPGTYPPEPVNGCMVSGFDAPVTTRATRSFIYPRSLADEVMRLGGFTFADFQEFNVGPGWYRTALSRLLQGVERKRDLALARLQPLRRIGHTQRRQRTLHRPIQHTAHFIASCGSRLHANGQIDARPLHHRHAVRQARHRHGDREGQPQRTLYRLSLDRGAGVGMHLPQTRCRRLVRIQCQRGT